MSDDWSVVEIDGDREREAESRSDAEAIKEGCEDLGMDVEIVPPATTDGGTAATEIEHPGGDSIEAHTQTAEVVEDSDGLGQDLGERTVAEDPLNWLPGEFVDTIDGSEAINRKGFEVLGHFYGVDVETEIVVPPEEAGHEYCRAEATATTEDGREITAHGSASTDRGDDSYLLLEMADTRARKRAISVATGAGAVAVEELRNEANGGGGS